MGALVLVRSPNTSEYLDDKGEGPSEVNIKISDVSYELLVSKRKNKMLVNSNRCKKWKQVEALVLRVMIAREEEDRKIE